MIENHVDKYLIKYNENINIYGYIPHDRIEFYCFDTESSRVPHNEEYEHVWAWAISNTYNDYVVYGNTLQEFIDCCSKLVLDCIKTIKPTAKEMRKLPRLKMFCHNLQWDIEFFKYFFLENGYTYFRKDVNNGELQNNKMKMKSFNIAENRNIVYGADICVDKSISVSNKQLPISISMFDSLKIVPQSLDSISKEVIHIPEMFYKLSVQFDYETARAYNHNLNAIERCYMYNDVYILKEFINQFYIPLETNMKTASGIAFESFITETFGGDYKTSYKLFEEHFPVQYNPKVQQIVRASYNGGWTQSNRKYTGREIETNNALSIDINSSYPSVVKYKPLPYGQPMLLRGKPEYTDEYKNAIITICFDGFRNKDKDNLLGEFKCLSCNTETFKVTGNEYIATNIINNKCSGKGNMKHHKYLYQISIWDFELENILENVELLIANREYNEITEEETITQGFKVGYITESSLMFKMETGLFASSVDKCMEDKNEGKRTGNKCLTLQGKLKANSFYGKLASSTERDIRNLSVNDKGLSEFKSDGRCYETDKKYYVPFASCVTAWARVNLRTTLYKVGYNNVLYFDTDSLYTTLSYEELLTKNIDLDPYKLGAWDIEKEYTTFKAIGAKKYILMGKSFGKTGDNKVICKCAGLPKDVRNTIQFEDFYLGKTFTGKKSKRKVKGGYRLVEGEYTLNLAIFD